MNLLAILGVGGALYAIFKPSSSQPVVDHLVSQAMPIAQDQMAAGASFNQAVAIAASQVTATLKPGPNCTLLGVKRTVYMDSVLSDAIAKAKADGLIVTPVYGQTLYKGTRSETVETAYWACTPQKAQ